MIIIKKYRNRRFYNSSHSCYVRLPEIQKFVEDGEEIQVLSHPEGLDLTKQFLLELALEKTELSQVFTNDWLQKIVRIAGTVQEERLLHGLFTFLENGQVDLEEESLISEEVEQTKLVEYVDSGSTGIPIQLKPDDLLELGWEEHSDTEEVEETQVSITNWEQEDSSEKHEWLPEQTVERIEKTQESPEEEDAFFNAIAQSMEDSDEELISEEDVERSEGVDFIIPTEMAFKDVVLGDLQEDIFPEVERIAKSSVEQEVIAEKKPLSQKELLQAKLAALKAKLGQ
jgi:polyhydroxyalkanoate synthesis repressor PhaR